MKAFLTDLIANRKVYIAGAGLVFLGLYHLTQGDVPAGIGFILQGLTALGLRHETAAPVLAEDQAPPPRPQGPRVLRMVGCLVAVALVGAGSAVVTGNDKVARCDKVASACPACPCGCGVTGVCECLPRETVEPPLAGERPWLPAFAECQERRDAALRWCACLEEMAGLVGGWSATQVARELETARYLAAVWQQAYWATCPQASTALRQEAAEELRGIVGETAYFAGALPGRVQTFARASGWEMRPETCCFSQQR